MDAPADIMAAPAWAIGPELTIAQAADTRNQLLQALPARP
jgi:hypothetical protein